MISHSEEKVVCQQSCYPKNFPCFFLVIGIVGAESTLHQLLLDGEQNYVLTDLNLGYMQIWFVRIAPDKSSFLTG